MPTPPDAPPDFEVLHDAGAFVDHVGPIYVRPSDGALGLRVEDRHLNVAGTAMGGLLATLVDLAFGRAIRDEAADGASVATVSLTTDYLRPAAPGVWLEAGAEVERLTGRLAFGDCSLHADGEEAVRARAVFAVRSES
ncbi:PaaI family thioesterase [Solirubrobacter phytolaccae]|uniref:PaaI family thioesterase n=1 Tax=Solirubrobacter phytolaccae TaxID=1404360 RepID=A0A9X3N2Y4_9ACTN|nr:PaaI family thioesterase [Solirubrobacter phytolaccae]MDA0178778.1 PaaI family thioesterase [Solirubrobacter phytolaccae]